MFCESCGTVLNVHGQCVNCDKKQLKREINTEKQEAVSSEMVG